MEGTNPGVRNNMTITDKHYPLCSKLGVLRKLTNQHRLPTISTTALHDALGWKTYQKFLPHMKHIGNSNVDPASCEAWLGSLDGKR